MADEQTTAENLITELIKAAAEFAPADAATFETEALDELAAYRLARETVTVVEEREGRVRAVPAFSIPERYARRAEVFVVFEAFVRYFIDPIVVNAEISELLQNNDFVERLGFARFGEREIATISIRNIGFLRDDAKILTEMAADLGRDLFGEQFRPQDFWE
jgi:hypothetical protein